MTEQTIVVTPAYAIAFAVYLLFAGSGVALRVAILWRVWRLYRRAPELSRARRFLAMSAYWIGGEGATALALILATVAQALPQGWLYPLVVVFVAGSTAADYGMLLWVGMWLHGESNEYRRFSTENGTLDQSALYGLKAWEAYLDSRGFQGSGNGHAGGDGRTDGAERAA